MVGFEGSHKCGGCHEANDHCGGNGFALPGRFSSCTDKGFECDRCAVVPIIVHVFLGSGCSVVAIGGGRPLSSFDELPSLAVLNTSW